MMYMIRNLFVAIPLLFTTASAEMKCAPGKCGSGKCGSMMKLSETKTKIVHTAEGKPVAIVPKTYHCAECNMFVNDPDYAAELITPEGRVYFFDDIGCLVKWITKHPVPNADLFVYTLDTHRWAKAEKVWYSRTDNTPMHYGFGAYEKKKEGMVSFGEMKTLMHQGKTLRNPAVKKRLLEE